MKNTLYLLLLFSTLLLCSCDKDSIVLVGYEDGVKLEEGDNVPFLLDQNYPNPFNPNTTIYYQVGINTSLKLKVYSDDWQEVVTLVDKPNHDVGYYRVSFDGKNSKGEYIPSGEYFYTLEGDGFILLRKMKLLK